jgi:hypothetical protein
LSQLLPRKMELEQKYLEEALLLLTSSQVSACLCSWLRSVVLDHRVMDLIIITLIDHLAHCSCAPLQSESRLQILSALFSQPVSDIVDMTYDTDVAVEARSSDQSGKGQLSDALLHAISSIRAGSCDAATLKSLAMSAASMLSATASLYRSRQAGRLGKGGKGMLKRATQRTAGVLAMRASLSTAVTGAYDGVLGVDPTVLSNICERMKQVFELHGAVPLHSPLLRPKSVAVKAQGSGSGPGSGPGQGPGPAEVINPRGVILTLPEDLTASFGRLGVLLFVCTLPAP